MRAFLRGKKPLRNLFSLFASFCVLSAMVLLGHVYNADSAISWMTNIYVNDAKAGKITAGTECTDVAFADYFTSVESNDSDKWNSMPFPEDQASLIACPEEGYVFSAWKVNGTEVSKAEVLQKSQDYVAFNDETNQIDIEAVFAPIKKDEKSSEGGSLQKGGSDSEPLRAVPSYTTTVSVTNSYYGSVRITSGEDYTASPSGENATSVSLTSTETDVTVTILAVPGTGYALRSSGISTTGDVTYDDNLNNNEFTVTMTGAGTVSVDFVPTRTATFSVNDSTYGDLVYHGDSNYGWGDLDCNSSEHVSSVSFGEMETYDPSWGAHVAETQIDITWHNIFACPKDGATFIGWKINGADVANPLNELNVINRNGYALNTTTLKPLFTDENNLTIEAVFYYDVEFDAYPTGAGDLMMNNTSNYYIAEPNSERTDILMLHVDPARSDVVTNSLIVRELASDYTFDHFEYATGNVTHRSQTQSGHTFTLNGPDQIKAVFVSSHRVNYSTSNANITPVEPGTTIAKSYDSIGSYDDDPTGVGVIVDPSVAANYKLMYWQDENGKAVSVDSDFVPTGSLIRDGATYSPVFDTSGNKRASFTINIPEAGHFRYWSNSQGRWIDMATGAGLIVGRNGSDQFASNSYVVADDPNYVFDHWDVIFPDGHVGVVSDTSCTEHDTTQSGCFDSTQGTYGDNNLYHVVAVFKHRDITYESNPIPHAKGAKGTIYEPYTSNIKEGDPIASASGAEARTTNDYYFLYWSDEDNNIVSYDEIFTPTGSQLQAGAIYYANFCDVRYTCVLFTVNDKTMGYVTEQNYGDVTDYTGLPPVEFDCDANGCSPHVTIRALTTDPDEYFFRHWEISEDGTNFEVLRVEDLSATMSPATVLPLEAGQRYILKAVYSICEVMCFHDYSYGVVDPYDTEFYGSTENIVNANDEVIGGRAIARSQSNNPYFAYWTTGCAGLEGGGFANETIVSLDEEFYPDAATLAQCSEFIAVFYRSAETRVVVTTNRPHDSNAQVIIQGDGETGKDATNYINFGVRRDNTGHPGLASVARSMEAQAPPGYRFSHWTINGDPLVNTDGDEITSASLSRSSNANSTSANIPWFTPLSGDINVLEAHFELLPLPFTGAYTIWWIVGGGIGLVAIPSIILIFNERKEQRKGGKK